MDRGHAHCVSEWWVIPLLLTATEHRQHSHWRWLPLVCTAHLSTNAVVGRFLMRWVGRLLAEKQLLLLLLLHIQQRRGQWDH